VVITYIEMLKIVVSPAFMHAILHLWRRLRDYYTTLQEWKMKKGKLLMTVSLVLLLPV
jgi:hypothetical protein